MKPEGARQGIEGAGWEDEGENSSWKAKRRKQTGLAAKAADTQQRDYSQKQNQRRNGSIESIVEPVELDPRLQPGCGAG